MSRYDRGVTVFSPDGQLLQVQYALEAVRKGSSCVGVRGANLIVLAVEKRSLFKIQDDRTEKKMVPLDEHVVIAFAGLKADARVLVGRAQIECQSYKLTVDDPVTVEYITKYIAGMKQEYTQGHGRRPFGLSCLVAGYDPDGTAHLFQTDPSGNFYEWRAACTGRKEDVVHKYLENNYKSHTVASDGGTIKLALAALMEINRPGQRNLEVVVLKKDSPMKILNVETLNFFIDEVEKEKSDAKKRK